MAILRHFHRLFVQRRPWRRQRSAVREWCCFRRWRHDPVVWRLRRRSFVWRRRCLRRPASNFIILLDIIEVVFQIIHCEARTICLLRLLFGLMAACGFSRRSSSVCFTNCLPHARCSTAANWCTLRCHGLVLYLMCLTAELASPSRSAIIFTRR